MTKAERRATQEAQRAKKAAAATDLAAGGDAKSTASKSSKPVPKDKPVKTAAATDTTRTALTDRSSKGYGAHRPVDMFSHLPPFKAMDLSKAITKQDVRFTFNVSSNLQSIF